MAQVIVNIIEYENFIIVLSPSLSEQQCPEITRGEVFKKKKKKEKNYAIINVK